MNLKEQWALACLTNGYRDPGNLSTPQKVSMMREWEQEKPTVEEELPVVPAPKKRGRKPK